MQLFPAMWTPHNMEMKTLGIIGAGHIGSQVARLAIASGYDVVISNSRGPETLTALVTELGPKARAGTSARRGQGWRHCRRYSSAKELSGYSC